MYKNLLVVYYLLFDPIADSKLKLAEVPIHFYRKNNLNVQVVFTEDLRLPPLGVGTNKRWENLN